MRFLEFRQTNLTEGTGLRAATVDEVYVDRDGTEYNFNLWDFQYPNDADTFETPENVQDAIEELANPQVEIRWVNAASSRLRAFAFAKFKSNTNKELWLGKYFQSVKPTNTIYDKEAIAVNLTPAKGSAVTKASVNMQPGHLGVADGNSRNTQAIVNIIKNHEQGDMLTKAALEASSNEEIIFPEGAQYRTAIQDDFCEVLAPIAIVTGHKVVTGSIQQAITDIFKTSKINDALIMFPPEQNNPLIDAFVIRDGIEMGISHKGKTGARASITNIWRAKEEASQTTTGSAYIKKYPEAVAILDICREESAAIQPIILASRFNLISEEEANKLTELMQNPMDPALRLEGNAMSPKAVVRQATDSDTAKVPQELLRIFKMGGYKRGSFVSYLCLARVATLVAEHINSDPEIDFGEAIRSFLNSSAMVQAKTSVGIKAKDAMIRNINVVYPPNFQDKAKIEANAYYGTTVKSKFSFSLPTT